MDSDVTQTSVSASVLTSPHVSEGAPAVDSVPSSSSDAGSVDITARKKPTDDPISSTSDVGDRVEFRQKTKRVKSDSDNEVDIFANECNLSDMSSEKITENVEDIVSDLENLLGNSTEDYTATLNENRKNESMPEFDDLLFSFDEKKTDKGATHVDIQSSHPKSDEQEEKVDTQCCAVKDKEPDRCAEKSVVPTPGAENEQVCGPSGVIQDVADITLVPVKVDLHELKDIPTDSTPEVTTRENTSLDFVTSNVPQIACLDVNRASQSSDNNTVREIHSTADDCVTTVISECKGNSSDRKEEVQVTPSEIRKHQNEELKQEIIDKTKSVELATSTDDKEEAEHVQHEKMIVESIDVTVEIREETLSTGKRETDDTIEQEVSTPKPESDAGQIPEEVEETQTSPEVDEVKSPDVAEKVKSPESLEEAESPMVVDEIKSPEETEDVISPKELEKEDVEEVKSPPKVEEGKSPIEEDEAKSPEDVDEVKSTEELVEVKSPDNVEGVKSPQKVEEYESPIEVDEAKSSEYIDEVKSSEELVEAKSPEVVEGVKSPQKVEEDELPIEVDEAKSPEDMDKVKSPEVEEAKSVEAEEVESVDEVEVAESPEEVEETKSPEEISVPLISTVTEMLTPETERKPECNKRQTPEVQVTESSDPGESTEDEEDSKPVEDEAMTIEEVEDVTLEETMEIQEESTTFTVEEVDDAPVETIVETTKESDTITFEEVDFSPREVQETCETGVIEEVDDALMESVVETREESDTVTIGEVDVESSETVVEEIIEESTTAKFIEVDTASNESAVEETHGELKTVAFDEGDVAHIKSVVEEPETVTFEDDAEEIHGDSETGIVVEINAASKVEESPSADQQTIDIYSSEEEMENKQPKEVSEKINKLPTCSETGEGEEIEETTVEPNTDEVQSESKVEVGEDVEETKSDELSPDVDKSSDLVKPRDEEEKRCVVEDEDVKAPVSGEENDETSNKDHPPTFSKVEVLNEVIEVQQEIEEPKHNEEVEITKPLSNVKHSDTAKQDSKPLLSQVVEKNLEFSEDLPETDSNTEDNNSQKSEQSDNIEEPSESKVTLIVVEPEEPQNSEKTGELDQDVEDTIIEEVTKLNLDKVKISDNFEVVDTPQLRDSLSVEVNNSKLCKNVVESNISDADALSAEVEKLKVESNIPEQSGSPTEGSEISEHQDTTNSNFDVEPKQIEDLKLSSVVEECGKSNLDADMQKLNIESENPKIQVEESNLTNTQRNPNFEKSKVLEEKEKLVEALNEESTEGELKLRGNVHESKVGQSTDKTKLDEDSDEKVKLAENTPDLSGNVKLARDSGESSAEESGETKVGEESGEPKLSEGSSKQNLAEESGTSKLAKESGNAKLVEESGTPKLAEESSEIKLSEESGTPKLAEESGKPKLSEESDKSKPDEESSNIKKAIPNESSLAEEFQANKLKLDDMQSNIDEEAEKPEQSSAVKDDSKPHDDTTEPGVARKDHTRKLVENEKSYKPKICEETIVVKEASKDAPESSHVESTSQESKRRNKRKRSEEIEDSNEVKRSKHSSLPKDAATDVSEDLEVPKIAEKSGVLKETVPSDVENLLASKNEKVCSITSTQKEATKVQVCSTSTKQNDNVIVQNEFEENKQVCGISGRSDISTTQNEMSEISEATELKVEVNASDVCENLTPEITSVNSEELSHQIDANVVEVSISSLDKNIEDSKTVPELQTCEAKEVVPVVEILSDMTQESNDVPDKFVNPLDVIVEEEAGISNSVEESKNDISIGSERLSTKTTVVGEKLVTQDIKIVDVVPDTKPLGLSKLIETVPKEPTGATMKVSKIVAIEEEGSSISKVEYSKKTESTQNETSGDTKELTEGEDDKMDTSEDNSFIFSATETVQDFEEEKMDTSDGRKVVKQLGKQTIVPNIKEEVKNPIASQKIEPKKDESRAITVLCSSKEVFCSDEVKTVLRDEKIEAIKVTALPLKVIDQGKNVDLDQAVELPADNVQSAGDKHKNNTKAVKEIVCVKETKTLKIEGEGSSNVQELLVGSSKVIKQSVDVVDKSDNVPSEVIAEDNQLIKITKVVDKKLVVPAKEDKVDNVREQDRAKVDKTVVKKGKVKEVKPIEERVEEITEGKSKIQDAKVMNVTKPIEKIQVISKEVKDTDVKKDEEVISANDTAENTDNIIKLPGRKGAEVIPKTTDDNTSQLSGTTEDTLSKKPKETTTKDDQSGAVESKIGNDENEEGDKMVKAKRGRKKKGTSSKVASKIILTRGNKKRNEKEALRKLEEANDNSLVNKDVLSPVEQENMDVDKVPKKGIKRKYEKVKKLPKKEDAAASTAGEIVSVEDKNENEIDVKITKINKKKTEKIGKTLKKDKVSDVSKNNSGKVSVVDRVTRGNKRQIEKEKKLKETLTTKIETVTKDQKVKAVASELPNKEETIAVSTENRIPVVEESTESTSEIEVQGEMNPEEELVKAALDASFDGSKSADDDTCLQVSESIRVSEQRKVVEDVHRSERDMEEMALIQAAQESQNREAEEKTLILAANQAESNRKVHRHEEYRKPLNILVDGIQNSNVSSASVIKEAESTSCEDRDHAQKELSSDDDKHSEYSSKINQNQELKLTIRKTKTEEPSSILKIYDPKNPHTLEISPSESETEIEEAPIPKLIIKQCSPKAMSPLKITIKPVLKPEEMMSQKSSPKLIIKPILKPEDEDKIEEKHHSPKITIKPILKPTEDSERCNSPKITIKPIIKPVEASMSPKIKIKPIVRPDDEPSIEEDESKERIVLKINKINFPHKETKKADENEKLAKIKLKFTKGGGHAHIVNDEIIDVDKPNLKRHNVDDPPIEVKKLKLDVHTESIPGEAESKRNNPQKFDSFKVSDKMEEEPLTVPSSSPRKRGRPRKVPLVVREEFKDPTEAMPEPVVAEVPPDPPETSSGRPKRSCRGPSVRTTLGIKPRKPRGAGRGRGRGRGGASVVADDGGGDGGGGGTSSRVTRGGRIEKEPKKGKISESKLKLIKEAAITAQVKESLENQDVDRVKEEVVIEATVATVEPVIIIIDEDEVKVEEKPIEPVASPLKPEPEEVDPLATTDVVMYEEETRMSADTNSRAQTPAKQVLSSTVQDVVEESQSSVQSTATTESVKVRKVPRTEVHQDPDCSVVTADQLAEYYWGNGGPFMLQEQVAQFLGIKSFKRKYPGIQRRPVEMQERDFIREGSLASENLCDLGLTAVLSADILDIMYTDFQPKYEEYCKHLRDKQTKDIANKQKALSLAASQEKNKLDIMQQAVESAAQWNTNFNKSRKEERRACMDLQTFTINFPRGKCKVPSKPKLGNYPIALVPGQYTDYYKPFTPTELNNLPLNTMLYHPININNEEDSQSDGSGSETDSSSSGSDSSDSDSSDEDCNICSPGAGSGKKAVM